MVDDDRAVRDALRRALTLGGYEVQVAEGGEAGLAQVAAGQPDAMVLDVMMPDLSGIEVCRHLRRAGDRIPILMLTARDAISDRVEGLDAGADDYLVKPFDVDELKARVRALLRRTGDGADPNALRVYVGYLRRKLEDAGARPLIHTVRGVGYALREP